MRIKQRIQKKKNLRNKRKCKLQIVYITTGSNVVPGVTKKNKNKKWKKNVRNKYLNVNKKKTLV